MDTDIDSFISLEDYESERTIVDIYDNETHEQLNANDLLDGNEEGLNMQIRSGLVLAQKSGEYKYCCSYCNQPLMLTRRRLQYGGYSIYYFSHFRDSADCPIKTVNDSGNPFGWAKNVYLNNKGGKLHQDMQNALMRTLQTAEGFSDPRAFELVKDKSLVDGWRRPDVIAQYHDAKIVFEFQLCSTFITGILDRIAYYKILSMNLIWLFPKFDKVDQELCEKDTLYSHKRNVFVFDSSKYYKDGELPFSGYQCAQDISIKRGKLMINVWWQTPKIENDTVKVEWHHKLIGFDELTIDSQTNDVYYHNSDYDFYDAASIEERKVIDEWERVKSERWAKIWNNVKLRQERFLREQQQSEQEQRAKRLLRELYSGTLSPEPFKGDDGLWGYKVEDYIVIRPSFNEITNFHDGIAWVKKANWGAINFVGKKVVNFGYSELTSVKEGLHIVRDKTTKDFFLVDQKGVKVSRSYKEIRCESPYNKPSADKTDGTKESHDALLARKKDGNWGIISYQDEVIVDFIYDSLQFSHGGNFKAGIIEETRQYVKSSWHGFYRWGYENIYSYAFLNKKGKVLPSQVKSCGPIKIGYAFGRWGILDPQSVWFNKFDYREITHVCAGYYLLTKEEKYAKSSSYVVTLDKVLISLSGLHRPSVTLLENKYFKIISDSRCGIYSVEGNVILEPIYSSVKLIASDVFEVETRFDGVERYDSRGLFIPLEKICISDNLYVANKAGLYGLLDSGNEILVPYNYPKYEGFHDNSIICFSKDGIIDYYSTKGKLLNIEHYSLDIPSGINLTRNSRGWKVVDIEGNTIQDKLFYGQIISLSKDRHLIGDVLYDNEGKKVLYDGVNAPVIKNPIAFNEENKYIVETSINGKDKKPYMLDVVSLTETVLPDVLRNASYVGDGYFMGHSWNGYVVYDRDGVELCEGEGLSYVGDSLFKCKNGYISLPLEKKVPKQVIWSLKPETHSYKKTYTVPSKEYGIVVKKTIIGTRTHRYGLSTIDGVELLPAIYNEIQRSGCFFQVREDKTLSYFYWNGFNLRISSFIPSDIYEFNEEVLVEITNSQGKKLLLTPDGKQTIVNSSDEIMGFDNDRFLVTTSDGIGVCDWNGNFIIPCKYEKIANFCDNVYKVKKNGEWGLLSSDNQVIIHPMYDEIELPMGHLFVVRKGGKAGCLDLINGKTILDCKYDEIGAFVHGVAIIKNNNAFGLVSISGLELIRPFYDSIERKEKGFFIGKIGTKSALFDGTGRIFVPLGDYVIENIGIHQALLSKKYDRVVYQEIFNYNDGFTKHLVDNITGSLVLTKLFNLYGISDTQHNELVSCSYNSIKYIDDKTIIVSKYYGEHNLYGLITCSEDTILECDYKAIVVDKDNTDELYVQSCQNKKWSICKRKEIPSNFRYDSLDEIRRHKINSDKIEANVSKPITNKPIANSTNTKKTDVHQYIGIVCGKAPFGVFVKIPNVGKGLMKTFALKKAGMKVSNFNKGMKVCVTISEHNTTNGHITLKFIEIIP